MEVREGVGVNLVVNVGVFEDVTVGVLLNIGFVFVFVSVRVGV